MAEVQLPGHITPLSETAKCSEHEDQPLLIYCKPCKKLICLDCLEAAHEYHPTTSARKQLHSWKKDVPSLMLRALEQTRDRKATLKTLSDQLTTECGEYASEIQKRSTQQRDAVAQLDAQYEELLAEAENIYKSKKAALIQLMTKSYEDETAERIETLQEATKKVQAECSQLEDITSAFRTRLDSVSGTTSPGSEQPTLEQLETDCNTLTLADLADIMPNLQNAVTSEFTLLPDTKSAPAELVVREHMKNYYVKLNTALETLHGRADELLATGASGNAVGVVVQTSFYQECKDVVENNAQTLPKYKLAADPGKAYRENHLLLTTVSEEAGKELARLCGGGDVLVREKRHKGEVLRTTTGTVTHVKAVVCSNVLFCSYWLPAGVSVVEAVRRAGCSCSRVTDHKSKQDVTNTNTLAWFDSSTQCFLFVY